MTLCNCANAVPGNFHDVLLHYTAQGYRVIGLAYKPLSSLSYVKVQRARRSVVSSSSSAFGCEFVCCLHGFAADSFADLML